MISFPEPPPDSEAPVLATAVPLTASPYTRSLRKFATTVAPGEARYRIVHGLETEDIIVQTRIAGRVREGGISVIDKNSVELVFGGTLNEAMNVVIVG